MPKMAREPSGVVDRAPHPGYGRSSTRLIPDWCGCSTEYPPGPGGRRMVAVRPDLGARADGESAAALRAAEPRVVAIPSAEPRYAYATPVTSGMCLALTVVIRSGPCDGGMVSSIPIDGWWHCEWTGEKVRSNE